MLYRSRVMVVDDEPVAREMLETVLMIDGYDLAFAENGRQALEQAAAQPPDLILLDVMMPEMNGFEVCRHLRADPVLAHVPIVIVTALDDRDSRLRGIRAGADDFITKPFDIVELRARVGTITRLNRYQRLLAEQIKFRWVVQEAEDGYVVLDRHDHVRYLNPQARRYMNLPANDSACEDLQQLAAFTFLSLARETYQTYPEDAWEQWPTRYTMHRDRYLVRPEDVEEQALWLHVAVLATPDPKDDGYILRLRDVTERVQRLYEIGTFHNVVLHKLAIPLTHMYLGLDFLDTLADRAEDPEVKLHMDLVWEGYRRLERSLGQIRRYLDMADHVSATGGCELSAFPAAVKRVAADLRLQTVEVYVAPELQHESVSLAPWAVDVLLTEILSNAQKHHPSHSPIVEVRAVRIGEDRVSLTFTDNGRTLPAEILRQVWMPYYQVEENPTGEVPGMGLGLSTVALLLWNVGGRCSFSNRALQPGVVVELTLPLQKGGIDQGDDGAYSTSPTMIP